MIQWGITCFFEKKEDFGKIIELAPNFPINYLEIRGERPFFAPEDLSRSDIDYFRKIIERSGLRVTLHSTFYDINLSTINSFLQNATIDCYKKYLDLAATIGAEIMVVHAGYIHKDAVAHQQIHEIAEINLINNLQILGDYASSKNVVIGLENSPPNRHQLMVWEPGRQIDILKKVNHPHVRAVYDTAHAFLHGHDISGYYEKIEPYLAEMHIHNNDGKQDQHRSIADGAINYNHFFRDHRVSVPVIMEIRNIEEALQSLEWIKNFNV